MDLHVAAAQFAPDRCYLDTATVGLGLVAGAEAMHMDLEQWQRGRLSPRDYDGLVDRARIAYGQLVGATADRVGIVAQASVASGVAASALRPGDEVLLAVEDFTSVLFPFLQLEGIGVGVRVVPLADLLEAVRPSTTMVAVSAVQSADGRVLDLDGLHDAAVANDCLTYVDLTQAAGWLPGIRADRFSLTVCAAYKWLCSPRGSGFMTVDPAIADRVTPVAAGWYAGEDVWSSIYGPPLRLAPDGRRFDTSPAWSCWVGATPAVELLAAVGVEAIGAHDVRLANRILEGVGQAPSDSAILTLDREGALEALQAADIACAGRAGRLRLACHLYTSDADVDRVLEVLTT
ncbi:aminotransferase class V-fold PLP-dependent enzyme [soil metagenome]